MRRRGVRVNASIMKISDHEVSRDELALTNQAEYGDSKTCSGEHFPNIR